MARKPKLIRYATRLDKYNAKHERARARGKRWAEPKAHKPKEAPDGSD